MITSHMLIALLPLLVVSTTAIVVMLAIAVRRSHFWSATLTVVGLNLALLSLFAVIEVGPQFVTELLVVDHLSWFYIGLILISALASATFSYSYLADANINREEMYLLLLLAVVGGIVLVCSRHAASLFLGLEILSLPLYGMTAYMFFKKHALEAGLKYMVLSAATSATLLFGLALLYAQTGSLSFAGLGAHLVSSSSPDPVALIGLGLVLAAIAFKLSLPPFHFWTPDIYQGASAPAGAFIATAAKVAVFVVFWRLIQAIPLLQAPFLTNILAFLAIASILVGNLLALMQYNLKRLLGYSSIAHFGYLVILLGVVSMPLAQEAVEVYLLTYVLTTLAAFGVISLVSSAQAPTDADMLQDYRGLFWSNPFLAVILTICMLSLAGVPFTAGFIGKFYIVMVGVESHLWLQLGALVVGSALGVFYYLRVIVTLYQSEPTTRSHNPVHNWGYHAGGVALLLIAVLVLVIGVYPQPVLALLQI